MSDTFSDVMYNQGQLRGLGFALAEILKAHPQRPRIEAAIQSAIAREVAQVATKPVASEWIDGLRLVGTWLHPDRDG